MKKLLCLGFIFLSTTLLAAQPADVDIQNLRVKEPLPGQSVAAGYFDLHNQSGETLTLVSVDSNFADKVEMHESVDVNGQMQMHPVDSLEIKAGGTLSFSPGGYHLMIMGYHADQAKQKTPELTFHFVNGLTLTRSPKLVSW